MGCAQSGQKKPTNPSSKPLSKIQKDQSQIKNQSNINQQAVKKQNNQPSQSGTTPLTKKQIAQKRAKLKGALDEGDFSSFPKFQPFAFEPIITQ